MGARVPIESQHVDAPLTQSATFLVLTLADKLDAVRTARGSLSGIAGQAKNAPMRDSGAPAGRRSRTCASSSSASSWTWWAMP